MFVLAQLSFDLSSLPVVMLSTHFFSTRPSPAETYTLSLHDALPISPSAPISTAARACSGFPIPIPSAIGNRSEEHTSELQSLRHLVCRLLLEKKNRIIKMSVVMTTLFQLKSSLVSTLSVFNTVGK